VDFNDGTENTIDFAQWLDGPMFEALKVPEFFARYFVDGGTLVWPDGADIVLETLYAVTERPRPGRRLQPVKERKGRVATRSRARLRG
jgi:hypothetical protein